MPLQRLLMAVFPTALGKVTRRPRFSGTVPDLGPLSPAEGVPENVPDFDNWPPRLDS